MAALWGLACGGKWKVPDSSRMPDWQVLNLTDDSVIYGTIGPGGGAGVGGGDGKSRFDLEAQMTARRCLKETFSGSVCVCVCVCVCISESVVRSTDWRWLDLREDELTHEECR
jgi:hypothetical protein